MSSRPAEASVSDFDRFIDEEVRSAVASAETFGGLVASLPGIPPDLVLRRLSFLASEDGNPAFDNLAADARLDRAPEKLDQCRHLPLPHPLDSEFRFDAETAVSLAQRLLDATVDGDEILLVGVPTVAVELAGRLARRRYRFVGPDDCVTAATVALFDGQRFEAGIGNGSAAAALLDPPWYEQDVSAMLAECAVGCREEARVFMAAPGLGTRPLISLERVLYEKSALAVGLTLVGQVGSVDYRTPLFELAALERQNIARLAKWRRGDLLEFRASSPATRSSLPRIPRPCELTVRGVRLRLTGAREGPDTLTTIADSEVFPSVSGRAPGRSSANLWTSGNRAFAIDSRQGLAALKVIAAEQGLLPKRLTPIENDGAVSSAIAPSYNLIHQLRELIDREYNDARRLAGEGSWLATAMDWRC